MQLTDEMRCIYLCMRVIHRHAFDRVGCMTVAVTEDLATAVSDLDEPRIFSQSVVCMTIAYCTTSPSIDAGVCLLNQQLVFRAIVIIFGHLGLQDPSKGGCRRHFTLNPGKELVLPH
jgi:hypothetical protein